MTQKRLNGLATLSVKCDMARKLDFSTGTISLRKRSFNLFALNKSLA